MSNAATYGGVKEARYVDQLVNENATTQDIIDLINWAHAHPQTLEDVKDLAPQLLADNIYDTCANIHQFLYKNVQYQQDPDGEQNVKSPSRLWAEKLGDCKSFTIFAAAVLENLGINKIVRYTGNVANQDEHHVYLVIATPEGYQNNDYVVLDATLPEFNYEAPFVKYKDYNIDVASSDVTAMSIGNSTVKANWKNASQPLELQDINQAQARTIYARLLSESKSQLAFQFLQDWRSVHYGTANKQIAGKLWDKFTKSGPLGKLGDQIAKRKLQKALDDNLKKAGLIFLYLPHLDCKYAKDFKRFPLAMEKFFTAVELYVTFCQVFETNTGFNMQTEFLPAKALYRAGDLDGWEAAWKVCYYKMVVTDTYKLLIEALIENLQNVNPLTVIDSYLGEELAIEWKNWTAKAMLATGVEFGCQPFTPQQQQDYDNGMWGKKGLNHKGYLTIKVKIPVGNTPQQFINAWYASDEVPETNTNTERKGLKMNRPSIFFAAGPELYGADYKRQVYEGERFITSEPEILSSEYIRITINFLVSFTGTKPGGSVISNRSPSQNKDTAAFFVGFGYENKYTPGPISLGKAHIGFEPVSIIMAVTASLTAIIAIIKVIAEIMGKGVNEPGAPADPQYDFSRLYQGADGKWYAPQPDGGIVVVDDNGMVIGKLPVGSQPPPEIGYGGGSSNTKKLMGFGLLVTGGYFASKNL